MLLWLMDMGFAGGAAGGAATPVDPHFMLIGVGALLPLLVMLG